MTKKDSLNPTIKAGAYLNTDKKIIWKKKVCPSKVEALTSDDRSTQFREAL